MQGLMFYDPTQGEGEFYTTNGRGGVARTRLHIGWRGGWTKIVPGNFGGDGFTDLLFYQPSTGTGEFYRTDDRGRIHLLKQHTGWRSSWTQIIPGNFGGSGFTDLLFYDAAAGTGAFYTTDGQGGMSQLAVHTNWRTTWSQIVPGQFGGNGFTDLLFYEAASGMGEFYATDGQGRISQLALHTGWRTSWTQIIPGSFGGNGFTDLLFYEAPTGTGEFWTTNGQGGMSQLALHTNWRTSWTRIIPGNFGGNGFTDLLFYDAPSGTGEFHATNGQGGLTHLSTFSGWRRSWSQIVPGEFANESLCMTVHFKSLVPITQAVANFLDDQFAALFQLYARIGITVRRGQNEDLSGNAALMPLQNLDVGECRGQTTQDQRDLFANRNNAGPTDVVVYFVATLISTRGNLVGCATHPDGQPGAAIVQVFRANERWLTAHEIGHVLDLDHVCTRVTPQNPTPDTPCGPSHSDFLMFPTLAWTNVPPEIRTAEETRMRNSGFINRC